MTWYKNYLAAETQPWARQVQKEVDNLKNNFRTAEVNNLTRDDQLASSLRQVASASTAASQAAIDAASAAQAAADANATAIAANSTATTANTNALEALQDIIDLSSPGGPSINAANITGDTITGVNLQTGTSGRRTVVTSSNVGFYDDFGNYSGYIAAAGTDRAATLQINNNVSGIYLYNGGAEIYANGVLGINTQGVAVYGAGISSSSLSTGGVSCSSVSSTGAISGTTVSSTNFSGTINTSIAGNTQTTFGANLFINSSGNMFRNPTISSREAKEDIKPYVFDTEAFIAVEPVTFKYKDGVIANPDEAGVDHLGFILEDFENAGVAEHLTIPANEVDLYKGLRYDKLYMMLHKVVQEQHQTIKDLNERIATLEAKV